MLDPIIKFLKEKDELDAAKILLDTMAKYASSIEEYDTLGRLYHDIKEYNFARKWAEMALSIAKTPESLYACRANLAKLCNHMNDPEKALFYLKINERINPNNPEILLEQVFSFFLLNQKDESEKILRVLAQRDDIDENVRNRVNFNLGTYDLYKGKFQEGLRGFILTGKEIDITKKRSLPFKQWEGGIIPGQKLLIAAEAGIGDEIINFRFCKQLREFGMEPIWMTAGRPDLANVFSKNGTRSYSNLQEVVENEGQELMWCYSMALPIYLDVQPDNLWDGPYLTADSEYVEKHAPLFSHTAHKKKIGVRWSGNSRYEQDLHRVLDAERIFNLLPRDKASIYSLQRDENTEILNDYPEIVDLQSSMQTYSDTLGIMSHLDLIITSCTSVAHAALAMGKKVIVMVPISAYYTWASTHDQTSIWYGDNVTVLRQTDHQNWDKPFEELHLVLIEFFAKNNK